MVEADQPLIARRFCRTRGVEQVGQLLLDHLQSVNQPRKQMFAPCLADQRAVRQRQIDAVGGDADAGGFANDIVAIEGQQGDACPQIGQAPIRLFVIDIVFIFGPVDLADNGAQTCIVIGDGGVGLDSVHFDKPQRSGEHQLDLLRPFGMIEAWEQTARFGNSPDGAAHPLGQLFLNADGHGRFQSKNGLGGDPTKPSIDLANCWAAAS